MLAFLDESGDPGHKFERGSSRFFLVAIVTFEDHDEATACEAAAPHLERATLVIDGAGNRGFKRELQTYLRRRMNEGNTQRVAKVKIQSSHKNSLLQLADYVAGLEAGCLNGRPKAEELWRRYLASHSVTREVWPGPE